MEDRTLGVFHSPNGEKSIIGMDCDGDEKQQLYLYHQDHSRLETLVLSREHFHYGGGWSPDSRYFSYTSNRRHPGFFDVFIVDIESKESKTVFQFDGNCDVLSWIDQEHLLISITESNLDNTIYCLNLETNEKMRIGNSQVTAGYKNVLIRKNKTGGYLLTDKGEETYYLSSFSFEEPDQLVKLLHWQGCDIEEVKKSPNEEWLALSVNDQGYSRLWLYHVETTSKKEITGIPTGVFDSISWRNNDELIFTVKTPVIPGDIWQYSLIPGEVTRLTFVSDSETIARYGQEPDLCRFTSFDQLDVPYFFYNQGQGTDKPAVIYVHGGPEGQTKAEYNPVIQYLASQGFAVAAPNVRGSSGYGRSYIQMDDARKRMDSVKDIISLVKVLIETHQINPHKIGIVGRSYGGFMVLAAMTHYPDIWAAGVDIVGISNLKTLLTNTGPWRRRLRECEYGFLDQDSDFFDDIAPLHHSYKIKAPLLVFHGRNDTRVPISESEQLVKEMKTRGQEVNFTVFDNEGHQTEKRANHIVMHQNTIEFFIKHLVH
ncbi:alpha/beta hydrolase family protein [Neobacillus muris]|uniref:alpha/beta hydrolase family protein n=1 Tax=Neobacillus muris TaxID=2941334 RepID=UPI0020406B8B|nr:alpha/beta fold hydrolase [Neobacillus muris]